MRAFLPLRGTIAKEHSARRLFAFHAVVALLIAAPWLSPATESSLTIWVSKLKSTAISAGSSLWCRRIRRWCALLDCERLKGGTRYDQFPAELRKRVQSNQIEIIGGGFDANLEKIVQLQPDLILTNGPTQQRFAVPLKNMGYSVRELVAA